VYFVVCGWWDFIGRGWLSVKEVWCAQDRSVSRRVNCEFNCEFKTSASKKSLYVLTLVYLKRTNFDVEPFHWRCLAFRP
jgi:hypothetical protein